MYMDIKVLVVGALQENCYVCSIGNNAFIVDPGDEADRIIDACMGKNVVEIIVTHHHFDHVGALDEIKKYFKLEENVKSGMFNYEVIETRDYESGVIQNCLTQEKSTTGLPKSNVLYYDLQGNAWCCVRPSGTEPKIKFYIGVKGNSLEDADNKLQELTDAVKKFEN